MQKLGPVVNRIVIGDVGSGKTIVAFTIALTYLNGLDSGQCCLLAPTEVLAFQHYLKLVETIQKQNLNWVEVIYISGKLIQWNEEKLTKKKFEKKLEDYLQQNPQSKLFWVGTHALLNKEFISPNLVLVDEQHRFGVRQRQNLTESKEAQTSPHFISFTATPIPRTLALTIYKNLKPHFLKTLPGRSEIYTKITFFKDLEMQIIPKIRAQLELGRKIYVICNKVEDPEEAEEDGIWSVNKATKFLQTYFPEQILTVHGKLSEKKDILSEFKESESKNILVATTVVEVGVDVPTASLMIILNAERFGLAALHQIRGRVGRNNYEDNTCFLVIEEDFRWSKRLKYLVDYHDGFTLAEKDLELRGSGDLIGQVQSGMDGDLDLLLGLDQELYEQINQLVESMDYKDIESLPRLKNYLVSQSQKVWGE